MKEEENRNSSPGTRCIISSDLLKLGFRGEIKYEDMIRYKLFETEHRKKKKTYNVKTF